MLPTLAEVTGKSKFLASLLAMKKLSPSETKVIECLEKKEADRAPEEEAKDVVCPRETHIRGEKAARGI